MNTLILKKPLKRIPKLDNLDLVSKYISYLKLIRSGFFMEQAKNMAQFSDQEQFEKARNLYLEL